MYSYFETSVNKEGSSNDFIMKLTVEAPTNFVPDSGDLFLMWSAFKGWDTMSTMKAVSDVTIVWGLKIKGNSVSGWIPEASLTYQYCTPKHI
jgi:hypothetical protein